MAYDPNPAGTSLKGPKYIQDMQVEIFKLQGSVKSLNNVQEKFWGDFDRGFKEMDGLSKGIGEANQAITLINKSLDALTARVKKLEDNA